MKGIHEKSNPLVLVLKDFYTVFTSHRTLAPEARLRNKYPRKAKTEKARVDPLVRGAEKFISILKLGQNICLCSLI